MSSSFRLRYFLGLIPTAQKIDTAWAELFKMHDELQFIESSRELARFNELKNIVQSNDFQTKKRGIINLRLKGSPEYQILSELAGLENSKPLRNYFKFTQSPDFVRINTIIAGLQLERYLELGKVVESQGFISRKKEIESLQYKGSPEHVKRREYNALLKSSRLKRYNAAITSDEYQLFLELDASERAKVVNHPKKKDPKIKIYLKFLRSRAYRNLKTVEELGLPDKLEQLEQKIKSKTFSDRETFLKNKARFNTTPDYLIYEEFTKLSKNVDIIFYLKCLRSSLYINYKKIDGSGELARLRELRLKSEDHEFKKQVAFLKDKKRFESTPEFILETELGNLEKSKMITTYHKLKKRPELAFFDQWDVVLDENFKDQQLSTAVWEAGNFWGPKISGSGFSQADELQAYTGIKNIEIRNKVLSIVSKQESTDGKVWNPSFGIMPKKFEYSSSIINTGNTFRFKEGIIEAKVRFRAETGITSAFSLTGSRPFPQIDVFRSGLNRVGVGIVDQPGIAGIKKLVQVKGLNFSNFHVFRLEIIGHLLVWKINNQEVHREQLNRKPGDLFLNFTGSLHQPLKPESLPHHFEIDWVRCLEKKR
jgi:hypothetical protein